MIALYLFAQAADAAPGPDDADWLAYRDYERCITVQAARLEPSGASIDELLRAAKARCADQSEALAKTGRSKLFLEQRAIDAVKPIVADLRARRNGRTGHPDGTSSDRRIHEGRL